MSEIIRSELRKILEERALDVLVYSTKAVLIGWLPASWAAWGPLGKVLDLILPHLLGRLAAELARRGNFLKVDFSETGKLSRYEEQRGKFRELTKKKPDDLTDEEKKREEDFDRGADDLIEWD